VVIAIAGAFAGFLWIVAVLPALVSFALAVVVAAAWSAFLARQGSRPDRGSDTSLRPATHPSSGATMETERAVPFPTVRDREHRPKRDPDPIAIYLMPAGQLTGTRTQVLTQLDELIGVLADLRRTLCRAGSEPVDLPRRTLRLVERRVGSVLPLLVLALVATLA
jgi:hypothetical protein